MSEYLLTIAICTFNRARLLDDALRSFDAMVKPPGVPFELLIVDNNSVDNTRSVVKRWAERSEFTLRYVFESKQGLSRARNRAIKEASGHWIWYTDDDVYFSPGWLQGVLDGINSFPGASALAGRIVLVFDPAKPDWLPVSLLPYYGLTSFGDKPRWLEKTEEPVGANTAFRRRVFDDVGLFREDLGRDASLLVSGEETEMATRLQRRGHKIGYVPSAELRHRVDRNRTTMSWLRKRAFWGGVSDGLIDTSQRNLGRVELIREASTLILSVGKRMLSRKLGTEDQVKYAWQLGVARQYLSEAVLKYNAVDPKLDA